jgi:hypothetical protein
LADVDGRHKLNVTHYVSHCQGAGSYTKDVNASRITVTLGQSVTRWVRAEAAREWLCVSRFLADTLKERMTTNDTYANAMRRALARKPFLKTDGRYLSRENAHNRLAD